MISGIQALEALRAVVSGREDYVHQDGCVYKYEDGTPSCIVGHVLARWDMLDRVDGEGNKTKFSALIGRSGWRGIFSLQAVMALEVAQSLQDTGVSWGKAVECAAREVTE